MLDGKRILKTLLEQPEGDEKAPDTFEENPMEFILDKYVSLNEIMTELMTKDYREYLDAVFIVSPKPTSFKIVLHNGQYFYMTYMGPAYEASVAGKNYYLSNIGEKERCMIAISMLLRGGSPLKTKGPEGAEQEASAEEGGEEGGGSSLSASGGAEAGGGEEESPQLTETLLESIIRRQLITESRGIFGRKKGDIFSKDGKELEFIDAFMYPENGDFKSSKERESLVNKIEKKYNTKIEFVNSPSESSLAFAIAILQDKKNKKTVAWGKYYKRRPSNLMGSWSNNEIPEGWKLQISSSKKLSLPVSAQDLIKTDSTFSSIGNIISTVKNNSQGSPLGDQLVKALKDLNSGKLPTFKNQSENEAAIRDFFGEIMAPVALTKGLVEGQADEAEDILLKNATNETWKDCNIFWPQSKNYGLVDSVLVSPKGIEVGISSKGGAKGASASSTNIVDAIKKSSDTLKKSYKKYIEILNIISTNTAIDGVFRLAEKMDMLPDGLEKEIKKYISSGKSDFKGISRNARSLFDYGGVKEETKGFNAGFGLLSMLAKGVAKKINEDKTIKFSAASKAFLNQSSFIQIYCKTKTSGEDVVVTGFNAVYPPNFEGDIYIVAGKNYTSTGVKGKLSFSIG